MAFLDETGLNRLWQQIVAKLGTKADASSISTLQSEIDALESGKANTSHNHTITASASDDDVVVLTGTNGTNKVTYSASHANSGVTAGTYKSVTVNAKGHVTGGTNPTTLSGYGITDAYTKSQVDSSLSGKAASSHTHDDRYYTESEIDSKLSGKANTSHGNHVPTTQTANNAVFLRNDNTWATVTPANIGAAASSHTHNYAGSSSAGGSANSAVKLATARNITLSGDVAGTASFNGEADASITTTVSSMHGVTTAGTGAAYTATVTGISSLTAGVSFIMIPHTNSTTTTPTLNVNSLGAKGLRMRGSTATGTAMTASIAAWLASGRPVQVTYNGVYWVSEVTRPAASDLSGTVPIASGGTGASTAADARSNLGAAAASHTHDSLTDTIDGLSSIYFAADNGVSTIAFDSCTHTGVAYLGATDPSTLVNQRLLTAEILYDNDSGTTGTVTLSENASEFTFIDIIFGNGDGRISGVTRVYNPNDKVAECSCVLVGSNGFHNNYFARYTISNKTMTPSINYYLGGSLSGNESVTANGIYVTQVIGYR